MLAITSLHVAFRKPTIETVEISSRAVDFPGRHCEVVVPTDRIYARNDREPSLQGAFASGPQGLQTVEIEHCAQGGAENRQLPCCYHDFEQYGCMRKASVLQGPAPSSGAAQCARRAERRCFSSIQLPQGELPDRRAAFADGAGNGDAATANDAIGSH